jgi:hypothetical protein
VGADSTLLSFELAGSRVSRRRGGSDRSNRMRQRRLSRARGHIARQWSAGLSLRLGLLILSTLIRSMRVLVASWFAPATLWASAFASESAYPDGLSAGQLLAACDGDGFRVDAALSKGKIRAWDFQPFRKASKEYIRNSMDLDDLEARARFPPVGRGST